MSPPTILQPSALHPSILIDGPHLARRRRHQWPLPLGCLLVGLIIGWSLRGLFI